VTNAEEIRAALLAEQAAAQRAAEALQAAKDAEAAIELPSVHTLPDGVE
jgi:hypothetical protein